MKAFYFKQVKNCTIIVNNVGIEESHFDQLNINDSMSIDDTKS